MLEYAPTPAQVLFIGDAFPASYATTLDKGTYTLEYEVRSMNEISGRCFTHRGFFYL